MAFVPFEGRAQGFGGYPCGGSNLVNVLPEMMVSGQGCSQQPQGTCTLHHSQGVCHFPAALSRHLSRGDALPGSSLCCDHTAQSCVRCRVQVKLSKVMRC